MFSSFGITVHVRKHLNVDHHHHSVESISFGIFSGCEDVWEKEEERQESRIKNTWFSGPFPSPKILQNEYFCIQNEYCYIYSSTLNQTEKVWGNPK